MFFFVEMAKLRAMAQAYCRHLVQRDYWLRMMTSISHCAYEEPLRQLTAHLQALSDLEKRLLLVEPRLNIAVLPALSPDVLPGGRAADRYDGNDDCERYNTSNDVFANGIGQRVPFKFNGSFVARSDVYFAMRYKGEITVYDAITAWPAAIFFADSVSLCGDEALVLLYSGGLKLWRLAPSPEADADEFSPEPQLIASCDVKTERGHMICYDGRMAVLVHDGQEGQKVVKCFDVQLKELNSVVVEQEGYVRNITLSDSLLVWHLSHGWTESIVIGFEARQEVASGGTYRLLPEALYIKANRNEWVPHRVARADVGFALMKAEEYGGLEL